MRRKKTTLKDVKNVKAAGMRKPKITTIDVKILKRDYHEAGAGIAYTREEIEKMLSKYPDVDIKIIR